MKKQTVAVVFGGKSAEHEISFLSAKNILAAIDRNQFQVEVVIISKEGSWYHSFRDDFFGELKFLSDTKVPAFLEPSALVCKNGKPHLYKMNTGVFLPIDIAFPVLHGTYGEDGCVQGLFKMMNLPFVGCGVLGSAAGMDKEVMKRILKEANIPSAKYLALYSHIKYSYGFLAGQLGEPFFIKPASAGSSVGVHKIKSEDDFQEALKDAFKYDHTVLAEEFIKGREIECAVLGLNQSPKASRVGEIIPTHDFYSYEAKYLDEKGAAIELPAKIDPKTESVMQKLARETFTKMGCDGLTRVDFFLTEDNRIYVNEINTIPGFTKISMYPKMWEASGIGYSELITELLKLGFQAFELRNSLETKFASDQAR